MLNSDWVLFHLREALEELERTISEIEQDPEYYYGEFSVAMAHLYHHLNTAWNSKDASVVVTEQCSEEDFYAWRSFPIDIEMGR